MAGVSAVGLPGGAVIHAALAGPVSECCDTLTATQKSPIYVHKKKPCKILSLSFYIFGPFFITLLHTFSLFLSRSCLYI